jgi:hypothetical protein
VATVFALLFLLTLGFLVWGVASPKSFSKFSKKPLTRRDAAVGFGVIALVFFVLTGVTAPKTSTEEKPKPAAQAQTIKQTDAKPKKKSPVVTTKTTTETQPVPYESKTVEDGSLNKGTSKVTTSGVNGVKTLTYKVTYKDGKQTDKKLVKEEVTTKPVNQVTSMGTYVAPAPAPAAAAASNCNPNYSPCVPDVSYDIDCPDIGMRVTVTGYDQYNLDGDNDGIGCESY